MRIAFVSCYLNHHQLALCEELRKRCDDFCFVATSRISESRLSLGYEDMNEKYDFVVRAYEKGFTKEKLKEILLESDAVIFGACPDKYIDFRLKRDKLSFIFSERFLKKGLWRRFVPSVKKKIYERVVKHNERPVYVLCASAFLPLDLKLCSFDTSKCLKWGYFPEVSEREGYPERKNPVLRILWTGRLIELKKAQDAINAVNYLRKNNIDFKFDIIGEGDCEDKLRALVKRLDLEDKVNFLGSMPPEKVRENMASADILLMTSNFREGWGAVVNEAMSEGCAVLASSAVGSVPYLISDKENGLIYKYGSLKDMKSKLLCLAKDKSQREALGRKAFETIRKEYSAETAAERLCAFCLNADEEKLPKQGPMSRASVLKNNWYK